MEIFPTLVRPQPLKVGIEINIFLKLSESVRFVENIFHEVTPLNVTNAHFQQKSCIISPENRH